MVTYKNKTILICGEPKLLICGEIHYFRLKKCDWEKALDELCASGANSVAFYIPWLCHEMEYNCFDFTGITHEELDLRTFFRMCMERKLYIIARPGPFIMAEMKNEGIPYWVTEKHPELIPTGWQGRVTMTSQLDYTAPAFLKEASHWYDAVMPLIREYLVKAPDEGGVVGIQLDNEVGMLSWVDNSPDFTDSNLTQFVAYLREIYGDSADSRYGFDLEDPVIRRKAFEYADDGIALKLHRDFGRYSRCRAAAYIDALKGFAVKNGITGVPFFVNIHGSGGSRGIGYPIGVSQLYPCWNGDGREDILCGSDFYIGEVHIGNFADVYMANAITACTCDADKPIVSLEFEAGNNDYDDNLDFRLSPSAIDIKTRMFTAAGNRGLNYYLFAGGHNYRMDEKKGDGNDRIAITGEHHGFAAPLGPTLERGTVYDSTAAAMQLLRGNEKHLAEGVPYLDAVSFAFIPDYYMTEYCSPSSHAERRMLDDIRCVRDGGAWSILAKAMLLRGISFDCLNIQDCGPIGAALNGKALVLVSALYMDGSLQQKLSDFLADGGRLFVYGEVPKYDMEGNPCTILADTLGVTETTEYRFEHRIQRAVKPCGVFEGMPEAFLFELQTCTIREGEIFLRLYDTDGVCGFIRNCGLGKTVCMTAAYRCKLSMFDALFAQLGITSALSHDCAEHGIFMARTDVKGGGKLYHIINLDDSVKEFNFYDRGVRLFEKKLYLDRKGALMLPVSIPLSDDGKDVLLSSSAELLKTEFSKEGIALTFRLCDQNEKIILKSDRSVFAPDAIVTRCADQIHVTAFAKLRGENILRVIIQ